jgi:hypothetical protein
MSSASASAFQTTVTSELSALRAENAQLKSMIADIHAKMAGSSAPKGKRAAKETPEPSGEPKEKRQASAWILFSSKQVQPVIRTIEESLDKSEKSKVGTINQFAGQLWGQKKEWTAEEITEAWSSFTPPEVSKQTMDGKSKRSGSSTGSAAAGEPVADESGAGEKKKRKPQSEETKAAAAIKRAATKAAKAGNSSDAEETAPKANPMQGGGGSSPEIPADVPKAAPKKAAFAAKKKVVDLYLDPWQHDGKELLKNERGDVMTSDGEWVGTWNGKEIDESAPEPADFDQLTTRD